MTVRRADEVRRSGNSQRLSGSMFRRLILLFILVPIAELVLLIQLGRWVGLLFTMIGIVRWSFYLFVSPAAAVVGFAINLLVMYALSQHAEYFH